MGQNKTVLITRPEHGARPLANKLAELGYDTVIEPMLLIVPRAFQLPPAREYNAVIFTSGEAVRTLDGKEGLKDYLSLPALCVGKATEEAAKKLGFKETSVSGGNSQTLVRLVRGEATQKNMRNFLHICGRDTAGNIYTPLRSAGLRVDRLEVYEAMLAHTFTDDFIEKWKSNVVTHALFFSARTSENFAKLVVNEGLGDICSGIKAICLSQAVADKIKPAGWKAVQVAKEPTVQSLLSLLD